MSEQDLNRVRDLLVAASKAEEMGFSATQRALSNLVLCGLCPFEKTCSTQNCMLLNAQDAPPMPPPQAVNAMQPGFGEGASVYHHRPKTQIDRQVAFAQDGGRAIPEHHHAATL